MTGLARTVALLLGAALVGCVWLAWTGANDALVIPFKTLWDPSYALSNPAWYTTLGLTIGAAGVIVIVGAVIGARTMVIVGGLVGAATTVTWILSNAISKDANAIAVSSIQIGAYGAIAVSMALLLLAAIARDTDRATLR